MEEETAINETQSNLKETVSVEENKVSIFYYILLWVGIFIAFSTVVSFFAGDVGYIRTLILLVISIALLIKSTHKFVKKGTTTIPEIRHELSKGIIFLLVIFLVLVGVFFVVLTFFTF